MAACSYPTDVLPRQGVCQPFEITAIYPSPDAVDVPVDAIPTISFSDFPNPDTVDVSTLVLTTGPFRYTGRYVVDLLDRSVRLEPSGYLAGDRGFTLSLRPGMKSLIGCDLVAPPPYPDGERAEAYHFFFTTGPIASTPPAPIPIAPPAGFAAARDVLKSRCSGATCHLAVDSTPLRDDPLPTAHKLAAVEAPPDSTCVAAPAGDLSLCPRDARKNLVGVPSRQVARLIRAAPNDSARSYLVRKLLGAPPYEGHSSPPGRTLSTEELRVLVQWIDTGADP